MYKDATRGQIVVEIVGLITFTLLIISFVAAFFGDQTIPASFRRSLLLFVVFAILPVVIVLITNKLLSILAYAIWLCLCLSSIAFMFGWLKPVVWSLEYELLAYRWATWLGFINFALFWGSLYWLMRKVDITKRIKDL